MEITIEATLRNDNTKGELKSLRNRGYIPAILYGGGKEPLRICLKKIDFYRKMRQKGISDWLFNLKIPELNMSESVIIKEIQKAHTSDEIIHIDFQRISLEEKIELSVPMKIVGIPEGIVEILLHEIKIKGLPTKIPGYVEINIAGLKIGNVIYVRDIKLPKGVEVINTPDTIILNITSPVKEEMAPMPTSVVEPEVITRPKKEEKKEEGE